MVRLQKAAKGLIVSLRDPDGAAERGAQSGHFEPHLGRINLRDTVSLRKNGAALKKALVSKSFIMPMGLLVFCLDYAKNSLGVNGVFQSIEYKFGKFNKTNLYQRVLAIKEFRNNFVAHQEKELTDPVLAKTELGNWIGGLIALHNAKQSLSE